MVLSSSWCVTAMKRMAPEQNPSAPTDSAGRKLSRSAFLYTTACSRGTSSNMGCCASVACAAIHRHSPASGTSTRGIR